MALYNILFGKNPNSDKLCEILNLGNYEVGRYRDISLRDGYIIVLTRTGGGNREHYESTFESLKTHPNYLDVWDSTYCEFQFSIPDNDFTRNMTDDKDPGDNFF
jgi:arabinogalactan endo-1,4-beta-galactosidase